MARARRAARAAGAVGRDAGAVLRVRRPDALELDAIETLGRVVDASVTVSLSYERGRAAFAGRAAAIAALAPLASARRELPARTEHYAPASRAALGQLERSLFEPDAGACRRWRRDPPARGRERARRARARRTRDRRAAHAGMRRRGDRRRAAQPGGLGRSARTGSPSGPDPARARAQRALTDSATGGSLIGLLRCAGTSGEGTARDLLAWLRAPGVLAPRSSPTGSRPDCGAPAPRARRARASAGRLRTGRSMSLERLGQAADRARLR